MPLLHNRINTKELKEKMLAETEPRTTISFYRYFTIPDPQAFRDTLYERLQALSVFGRIYVAHEGINAQISVPASRFEALKETLYAVPELSGMRLNVAVDDDGKSFWVLKIKVRPQIVADGIEDPTFNPANTGQYLKAAEYNALIQSNPDVVVVDMRNHYEYEVGHFDGALEIPSDTFKEQLPMAVDMLQGAKDKPVVMYCTGGIRCEKASAYFKHQGFQNVYHLEGGIIEYTRKAREEQLPILFRGKNFVFDARMGERITDEVLAHCHQCGTPCDTHVNCTYDGCHLLFIQCPECAQTFDHCCSADCREAKAHNVPPPPKAKTGNPVFNKSKSRLRPFRPAGRDTDVTP
jgi:UPF0176 protein